MKRIIEFSTGNKIEYDDEGQIPAGSRSFLLDFSLMSTFTEASLPAQPKEAAATGGIECGGCRVVAVDEDGLDVVEVARAATAADVDIAVTRRRDEMAKQAAQRASVAKREATRSWTSIRRARASAPRARAARRAPRRTTARGARAPASDGSPPAALRPASSLAGGAS